MNYPRINELTEWYVVDRSERYQLIVNAGNPREATGRELSEGLAVRLEGSGEVRFVVRQARRP